MSARYPNLFEAMDDDLEGTNSILLFLFYLVF